MQVQLNNITLDPKHSQIYFEPCKSVQQLVFTLHVPMAICGWGFLFNCFSCTSLALFHYIKLYFVCFLLYSRPLMTRIGTCNTFLGYSHRVVWTCKILIWIVWVGCLKAMLYLINPSWVQQSRSGTLPMSSLKDRGTDQAHSRGWILFFLTLAATC